MDGIAYTGLIDEMIWDTAGETSIPLVDLVVHGRGPIRALRLQHLAEPPPNATARVTAEGTPELEE